MTKAKYIIFKSKTDLETPVVFSPLVQHSDVTLTYGEVVSAGFCAKESDGKYKVWGDSVSLGKKSRLEDADIINKYLEYNV